MGAAHRIIELDTVDSTNSYIREHPELWNSQFCTVAAREQTAGRGRHGCRWHSAAGLDLTFSLLFIPPAPPSGISGVTLLAGLGAYRALLPRLGEGLRLKWPNDLLHGGKKIGGILCELFDAGGRPAIIIGIGINVNSTGFPDFLDSATSMKIVTGRNHDTGPLLRDILEALTGILSGYQVPLEDGLLREWEAASSSLGAKVRYHRRDGMGRGIITGVDSRAFLLVRDEADARIVPYSGEVLFEDDE